MTAIAERQLVQAPLASAERTIRGFLAVHAGPDGVARIMLHAAPHGHYYPAVVTLMSTHRSGDMTPRFRVHWAPEGGDPHSAFDGELSVGAVEDYNAFTLMIDGRFEPRSGVAHLFDGVVGHRIEAETVRALLFEMAREIEGQIRREEAAKRTSLTKPVDR